MKNTLLIVFVFVAASASAQSKTTEALHKQHDDALSLFFYNNTLRMLNQSGDPAFDELIKNVEKMKFLMIDKGPKFSQADYKKLTSGYKGEKFEEIMTSRYQGKNFDVFMKDHSGKTEGMVVLVNDSASLYVLDIVGSIALNKITSFYKTFDSSTDISKKIKNFTQRNATKEDDDKD
jgi:sulfur relay (sulfurtransferase) complex TusBCD TusD component (DsrE family)